MLITDAAGWVTDCKDSERIPLRPLMTFQCCYNGFVQCDDVFVFYFQLYFTTSLSTLLLYDKTNRVNSIQTVLHYNLYLVYKTNAQ